MPVYVYMTYLRWVGQQLNTRHDWYHYRRATFTFVVHYHYDVAHLAALHTTHTPSTLPACLHSACNTVGRAGAVPPRADIRTPRATQQYLCTHDTPHLPARAIVPVHGTCHLPIPHPPTHTCPPVPPPDLLPLPLPMPLPGFWWDSTLAHMPMPHTLLTTLPYHTYLCNLAPCPPHIPPTAHLPIYPQPPPCGGQDLPFPPSPRLDLGLPCPTPFLPTHAVGFPWSWTPVLLPLTQHHVYHASALHNATPLLPALYIHL